MNDNNQIPAAATPENDAPPAPRLLLRDTEVAKLVGLAPITMRKLRCSGDGPPFIRCGRRAVRYYLDEVERWIDSNRFRSTAEYAPICHEVED